MVEAESASNNVDRNIWCIDEAESALTNFERNFWCGEEVESALDDIESPSDTLNVKISDSFPEDVTPMLIRADDGFDDVEGCEVSTAGIGSATDKLPVREGEDIVC